MLLSCDECPGFVPAGAHVCPQCGAPQLGVEAPPEDGSTTAIAKKVGMVAAAGAMMMTLMACYGDSYYDDGGLYCYSDADCPSGEHCDLSTDSCYVGEICNNGYDDDYDGLYDANDPDCQETSCSDSIDNDGDGFLDCEDSDCADDPYCIEECPDCGLEICGNGIDDDGDGAIDCADSECPVCTTTETECGNLFDDDQDGLSDCDDPDCTAVCFPAVCGDGEIAPTEECDDGNETDGDGCSSICTVELDVVCAAATLLEEGVTNGSTEGGTRVFSGSCIPTASGAEALYSYTAGVAGTLYVTLDPQVELGIYALDACDPLLPSVTCSDFLGGLDSISIDLVADQSIVVVVDSNDPNVSGAFSLATTFSPQ